MQRRVWSVDELEQILIAVDQANANPEALLAGGLLGVEPAALLQAYRQGFRAALAAVALATGIARVAGAAAERQSIPVNLCARGRG